jgi:hypothetical protein
LLVVFLTLVYLFPLTSTISSSLELTENDLLKTFEALLDITKGDLCFKLSEGGAKKQLGVVDKHRGAAGSDLREVRIKVLASMMVGWLGGREKEVRAWSKCARV